MGNNSTKSVAAEAYIDQKDPLDDNVRRPSSSRPHDPQHAYREKMPSAAKVDLGSLEPAKSSASSKSFVSRQGSPTLTSSKVSASLTSGQRASSNTFELCSICLEALANIPENGSTQHHTELLSLEESVRSGCHLCSLMRHFLPDRSRRESNTVVDAYFEVGRQLIRFIVGWMEA